MPVLWQAAQKMRIAVQIALTLNICVHTCKCLAKKAGTQSNIKIIFSNINIGILNFHHFHTFGASKMDRPDLPLVTTIRCFSSKMAEGWHPRWLAKTEPLCDPRIPLCLFPSHRYHPATPLHHSSPQKDVFVFFTPWFRGKKPVGESEISWVWGWMGWDGMGWDGMGSSNLLKIQVTF